MPNVTLEMIAEAGVVGAGGAGFPTHVKLAGKADTVLLNAAECEPLLHKDKEVLRDYLDANIEGLAIAMQLVGADRAIVGIKNKYEERHRALPRAAASKHGGLPVARRLSGGR